MAFGLAAVAGLACLALPARAEPAPWPARPIRLVFQFPPGGPGDALARILAQAMGESLGQAVVVENKPGGNAIVGTDLVAKAAPDGYTLLVAIDSSLTMNPTLFAKLPYDPVKDFVPIGLIAEIPMTIAVNSALPVANLKQLVDLAKQTPDGMHLGVATVTAQVYAEMFTRLAGIRTTLVTYKGGAAVVTALMAGEVPLTVDSLYAVTPAVQSGKVRALAVLSPARVAFAPNLPTIDEAGLPGFHVAVWQSLVAPAGTPQPIIDRLSSVLTRVMAQPSTREKVESVGMVPLGSDPAELRRRIGEDTRKWKKVIQESGITVN